MDELKKENTFSFDNQEELNKVLEKLQAIIDLYGYATVADFYELIEGDSHYHYKSTSYGWDTLSDFSITAHPKLNNIRILTVPEPKPISNFEAPCSYNLKEPVNHPSHYQSETGIEVIDVIEAFTFDLDGVSAFDTGNILKYICRWSKKNGLQDLKKAEWYLQHLIAHIENIEKENN